MSNDTTFNGWKNYETWCAGLWIDNDEYTQCYWQDHAEDCAKKFDRAKPYGNDSYSAATRELADRLKSEFEENSPLPDSGFYTDLLNAALGEIEWRDIAEGMIDAVEINNESGV